jgi:RarD protein
MCIFGSIGLIRKYIDLPSSIIALARAAIGTAFLFALMLGRKQKLNLPQLKANRILLLFSGAALGFNWILLFEAYCYTSVAVATLCYYMAPVLVIIFSPLLFKERITTKKLLCILTALIGIILVSGILAPSEGSSGNFRGILFGLAAAVLYATVVILNKKITIESSSDRTLIQLGIAAFILLPYTLLTEDYSVLQPDSFGIILLVTAGIIHTGIAYALYFGSIRLLPAQTAALYSYIDPILAILLSALFLQEPLPFSGILGAVLILGAAIISET